jgi:flagellar protein FlaJ
MYGTKKVNERARTTFLFMTKNSRWDTPTLGKDLRAARMDATPREWISVCYFYSVIVSALYIVISLALFFFSGLILVLGLLIIAPVVFGWNFFYFMGLPKRSAATRAIQIDNHLFFALNYMATMSASGMTPLETMRNIAKREIYGEAAREIAMVVRNVDVLGMDMYSALRDVGENTPSHRFREFVEGFVSTSNSTGNITGYLLKLLDQYKDESRIINEEKLESFGLISEVFVVVAISLPLFMSVILVIMALSAGGERGDTYAMVLFFIAFVMLPVIIFGFGYMLHKNKIGVD